MFDDEDDFLNEMNEQDPIDKIRLEEIWQEEIIKSMNFAYGMIEEMGIETWMTSLPIERDRKITILSNMLQWHEDQEEFEKCAILKKGLDTIKNNSNA
jgi:hypothetical protein